MVSTMAWNNPETTLPELAKRVLVETKEGSMLFGKLVIGPNNKQRWIDDQSLPIRDVLRWRDIVSEDETP